MPLPAASAATPVASQVESTLLGRLRRLSGQHRLNDLAAELAELEAWVGRDLADFERHLDELPRGGRAVQACAHYLLDRRGKHLRPMCVALAARMGAGFSETARRLAVAVELVHSATLLHDDVVDLGEMRRGATAARCVYGNAAAIFAGDWLLVEALRQILCAELPGLALLDRMLSVIEEMILAESVQLEGRGRVNVDLADYFKVVEGKTAALFRWAMYAGGRAGGLSESSALALEQFGHHLGIAFQAIDDLLDLGGDAHVTGKGLCADLREGKMTYPLILALARDPELHAALEPIAAGAEATPQLLEQVRRSAAQSGALRDCRRMAEERVARAIDALVPLPAGPGRQALVTVARATVQREC
jgi:octaprenyl-diphosphate synthase